MARKGGKGKTPKRTASKKRKARKPARKKPSARPAKAPAPPKPKSAPPARVVREEFEDQTVCSLEFLSDGRSFIARLDTLHGGMREHRAPTFTDLLELVAEDLREEFLEV